MFAFLNLIPLVWRLAAVGVIIAGLVGGYIYWYHHVYELGYAKAIADVAAADKAAVDRVKEGQNLIDNCTKQGGNWDVTTGRCL